MADNYRKQIKITHVCTDPHVWLASRKGYPYDTLCTGYDRQEVIEIAKKLLIAEDKEASRKAGY